MAMVRAGKSLFTGLGDTPSSYTGQSGKYTRVNSTEDGLEFVSTTETLAHSDLTDMPDLSGTNSDHDARYYTKTFSDSKYVPYSGASSDVNLGSRKLSTTGSVFANDFSGLKFIDNGGDFTITPDKGSNAYNLYVNVENNDITLEQSLGKADEVMFDSVEVDSGLKIPQTTDSTTGVIVQDGSSFIHSYGTDNIFIGEGSGNFFLTGSSNVGIGKDTLKNLTTGIQNFAIGAYAGDALTTGVMNFALGAYALSGCSTGGSNVAIGRSALIQNNNSGSIAIGRNALTNNLGGYNVAIGYYSGYGESGEDGDFNTYVGGRAGYGSGATTKTSSRNTGIGYYSLFAVDGDENVALGYYAGNNLQEGSRNIFIGSGVTASSATVSDELNIGNLITGDLNDGICTINDVLQLNGVTSDPSSLSDGMLWYRSDTNEIRVRLNSTTYSLDMTVV